MTRTAAPERTISDSLRGFFGVPFRGQTYRSLAYLLLAFPLGLVYFVAVSVGLATGVGLLVTLVGVPILLVTLYMVTLIAGFEASLARHLLDVDVPAPASLRRESWPDPVSVGSLLNWGRRTVTAPTTWAAVVLVGLKFVYSTLAFVVLSVAAATSLVLLAAPLVLVADVPLQFSLATDGFTFGVVGNGEPLWVADTIPEAAGLSLVGVFATLVSLHLVNALAKFGGISTAALLNVGGDDEPIA